MVMFVVFFNEKSHSEVSCLILISCHHSSSIFSCDVANNEMYDLLPSCLLTRLSLAPLYYHYVDG